MAYSFFNRFQYWNARISRGFCGEWRAGEASWQNHLQHPSCSSEWPWLCVCVYFGLFVSRSEFVCVCVSVCGQNSTANSYHRVLGADEITSQHNHFRSSAKHPSSCSRPPWCCGLLAILPQPLVFFKDEKGLRKDHHNTPAPFFIRQITKLKMAQCALPSDLDILDATS